MRHIVIGRFKTMAMELTMLSVMFLIAFFVSWLFIKKVPKVAIAITGFLVVLALVALGLNYAGFPQIETFLEQYMLISIPVTLAAGAILGDLLGRFT